MITEMIDNDRWKINEVTPSRAELIIFSRFPTQLIYRLGILPRRIAYAYSAWAFLRRWSQWLIYLKRGFRIDSLRGSLSPFRYLRRRGLNPLKG